MSHPANEFLERTTMRELFDLPARFLDQAMAVAYQCYQTGRYQEAEVLCKGLLAADHRYWWAYSLYAAVLRKLGRTDEALTQVEQGLRHEPAQPKLIQMKNQLVRKEAA